MVDKKVELILGTGTDLVKDVETSMLDYDYVEKCTDVLTLKDILRTLVSGKEGRYPHLEETVVNRILSLLPEKDKKRIVSMSTDISPSEIKHHKAELGEWVETLSHNQPQDYQKEKAKIKSNEHNNESGDDDIFSTEEVEKVKSKQVSSYPPIRGSCTSKATITISSTNNDVSNSRERKEINKSKGCSDVINSNQRISKERLSNRDYFRAWDTFDYEAAERIIDEDETEQKKDDDHDDDRVNDHHYDDQVMSVRKELPQRGKQQSWQRLLQKQRTRSMHELDEKRYQINYHNLSEMERKFMASREKSKGNECFRNKEYDESYLCYTKSLALDDQNAIVFANRAMVCIRLSNLCQAVSDCTQALLINPKYTKALARRGMVHFKCGRYMDAKKDFSECVNLEPLNNEYCMLLKRTNEKYNEVIGEKNFEKNKKRIAIIQDDESDTDISDEEDVIEEVYTPGCL